MRAVYLGQPPLPNDKDNNAVLIAWLVRGVAELGRASQDTISEQSADTFTLLNFDRGGDPNVPLANVDELRTFDWSTVTLPQLARVVATMISDMKRRGAKGARPGSVIS